MMREQLSNQPHYDFGLPAIIHFLKHIRNIKGKSVVSSAVEVIFSKVLKILFFFFQILQNALSEFYFTLLVIKSLKFY